MPNLEKIISEEQNSKKISQKIIDYAIWYYLNFFPSKKKISDKLREKFWPESEKWKKYWWISDEEISFIIEEKMKNLLQEENILKAKIKTFLRKWKNLNYIKTKLFEKKFDKDDIDRILNDDFLENPENLEIIENWWSLLNREKLEKNILILKNKWKSKKFISQKFIERKEDNKIVNEILEKIFFEKIEEDFDENWDEKIIDWDFENLKIEFEKVKSKRVRNKKTWEYEEISRQKIIEKLLWKWFWYENIKILFEENNLN